MLDNDLQGIGWTDQLAVAELIGLCSGCYREACAREYSGHGSMILVKVQPVFYSDPIDAVFKALGAS